jgi:glutathione S-transferase
MVDTTASADTTSSTPVPILHHLSAAQSMRVLWALEELAISNGFKYEVKLHTRVKSRAPPELKKIFPLGKAPVLEVPGVDNYYYPEGSPVADQTRTVVAESRLILQYISDQYSHGIWTPTEPKDKGRDIYWQEFANASLASVIVRVMMFDIVPAHSPFIVRPLMYAIFNPIARIIERDLSVYFDLMETTLAADTSKPWFAGRQLGLADFNISWAMDLASQRGYFPTEQYPHLAAWVKRVHDREAYRRALEKGGSYDLVKL